MSFLNPALLAGAALFAIPLVIHLLNRQRHKRRQWAAMEFLLRAFKKQRNRLRRENLLLLLLRCLVPILLALAIARPILDSMAGLALGGGTVHHVVVIDGTYSMALEWNGAESPFARARGMVGRLLDGLEQDPQQSGKVTIVLAGERPRFLVRGDLDLAVARAQWFSLQRPDDAAADLVDALSQVADYVEEEGDSDVQVYVFSDLQRRSMGQVLADAATAAAAAATGDPGQDPPAGELQDTMRDIVARFAEREGADLHLIDTGPHADSRLGGEVDNVQITELTVADPVAVARTPVSVVATLQNRSAASENVEVTLEIDGSEPIRRVVTVPAGAEGEAEFQVSFREPGRHQLRASLQNDALAADDERFLAVSVRDRVKVLLVDGDQSSDPLKAYAQLYGLVLDPDPQGLPTFAVHSVDTLALLGGQVLPVDYDITVLSDVPRLNNKATVGIAAALAAGKGVLVAFGPTTDASSYNLHLYAAGQGPQPFRLLAPLGGKAGSAVPRSPLITAQDHGTLAEFEEAIYREIFQKIPVYRWYGIVADSLRDDAIVTARLTDAEQSPLLIAAAAGDGKIAFLTSPPSSPYVPDRWNEFNDPVVAFPLLHGLGKWLALPAIDPFHVQVGAELTCSLPARPVSIEVQRPDRDGGGKVPVAEDALPLPGGRFALPPLADTRFAGFYRFEFVLDRENGREAMALPFAVNVNADEGDLRYATHDEAREALGLERVHVTLPTIAEAADDPDRSELGPTFLLATLLFVLMEGAMARFVSMRRN